MFDIAPFTREMKKAGENAEKALKYLKETGRLPTSYPLGKNLYECTTKRELNKNWLKREAKGQIVYLFSRTNYHSRFSKGFNNRHAKNEKKVKVESYEDIINSDFDICCIREVQFSKNNETIRFLNLTRGKPKWNWMHLDKFIRFVVYKTTLRCGMCDPRNVWTSCYVKLVVVLVC